MECPGAIKEENITFSEVPLEQIYGLTKEIISVTGVKEAYLMKENIPPRDFESNPFVKNDRPYILTQFIKATPKKQKKLVEDPLTPTTNFKLLTSLAAARDYANCDSQSENVIQESSPVILPSKEKLTRKEKSLSIICTRFLSMYPLYPRADENITVSLDEVCFKLAIERRRLYDIVNVFESIEMLMKLSKNRYRWYGKNNLYQSLQKMKEDAEKENVSAKLQYVLELEESKPDKQTCLLDDVSDFYNQLENGTSPLPPFPVQNETRREKSLAYMSQRFLMLFLVSPTKIISLSAAAKVLNGFHKSDGGAQMKTQIRRLYDIANVLSSIGLILKEVTVYNYGKKPAFKYIGPFVKGPILSKDSSHTTPKKAGEKSKNFTRHSSFQDICAVAEMEHKKLCLDESPKSAPPFERSFQPEPGPTSFSNFSFSTRPDASKTCEKDFKENAPKAPPKTPVQSESKAKQFPIQPNMTVVNVPKEALSGNASFYLLSPVLNCNTINASQPMGTLLLFTPESSSKALVLKTPKSQVDASKSREPLKQQRQSFNSTSNQLSTPQAVPLNINVQYGIPKKLDFISEPSESNDMKTQIKDTPMITVESYESSSKCSTRNSSPMSSTSRFGSPFSIPSGYVTPVPTVSSDVVFPSGVETLSILKGIEADSDQPKNLRPSSSKAQKSEEVEKAKSFTGDKENIHSLRTPAIQDLKQLPKTKLHAGNSIGFPLKDTSNFSALNYSCSNDSVNSEISEILNGKKLGENMCGKKLLEIDENTILSPIKKTKKELFPANPSQLVTFPAVPEKVFVFDSRSYQSLSVNNVIYPGTFKFNSKETKHNLYTS